MAREVLQQAAQGDVFVRRVSALPDGLRAAEAVAGRHVVAHSETGHHHWLAASGVERWEDPTDPLRCFLRIGDVGAVLTHDRAHDTHAPLLLGGGIWEVRRQREYSPAGWRRAVD